MFFGIGSVAGWMCGIPVLVGLFFLICSDPNKYLAKHMERRAKKTYREQQNGVKDTPLIVYLVIPIGILVVVLCCAAS